MTRQASQKGGLWAPASRFVMCSKSRLTRPRSPHGEQARGHPQVSTRLHGDNRLREPPAKPKRTPRSPVSAKATLQSQLEGTWTLVIVKASMGRVLARERGASARGARKDQRSCFLEARSVQGPRDPEEPGVFPKV